MLVNKNAQYYNKKQQMFEGQNKPNKNLWKSIKTQKTKYSGVDHAPQSPPYSYTKQTSLKSEPPVQSFNLAQQRKKQQSKRAQKLEKHFKEVQQEAQIQYSQVYQLQQPQNTHSRQSSNLAPVSLEYDKNVNKNGKYRRFSIGEQSVVEQIVDFKNFNQFDRNLDIVADFQQQQQPMMMSLGSQSNHMIKQLKLSKIKEDVQKLQFIRQEFIRHLKQQSNKYQQFFKLTFHQLVSFIIQFYSTKCEQTQQQIEKKDRVDISLQKQMSVNSSNRRINTIPIPFNRHSSHSQQDTPTFVRHQIKNRNSELEQVRSSLTIRNQLHQKIEQVQRLQEQIFKIKMENQTLQEKLHDIRQQNQQLSQSIFDYQQKIAQIQLQVNQKVAEKLSFQIEQAKKSIKQQQLEQFQKFQKQRKQQYMSQILELQEHIFRLEQKNKRQEYDQIRQTELKQRQDKLKHRQRQLKNRQIQLNQLQVELNSQRMDMQSKIQKIRMKQSQIKAEIDLIEQRQIQFEHKQKQLNKFHERLQKSRQKQVQVYERPAKYGHHRTSSGQNIQAQFDFKIKHLSDLKTDIRTSKHRGGTYRQEIQKHNASYALTQGNKNWKYPVFGTNNNESNSIRRRDGDLSSNNSKSGSKQKKKYFNKTYFNNQNRTSNVILKSNISSISGTHSRNTGNSGYKSNDKNRLDDLGAKLENLRQQIRKQIRQTS